MELRGDLRGQPVRDIGYLSWRDEEAALETMRGPRWAAAMREESARWSSAMASVPAGLVHDMREELAAAAAEEAESVVFLPGWRPLIGAGLREAPVPLRGNFKAFDVDKEHIWVIRDSHHGAERYDLTCWRRGSGSGRGPATAEKPLWVVRDVAPSFAIFGGRCYYVRAERIHWYRSAWSCDAVMGRDAREEWSVESDRELLEVIRTVGGVFLRTENSGASSLRYVCPRTGKIRVAVAKIAGGYQVPFGFREGAPVYAARAAGKDTYEVVGADAAGHRGRPIWGSYERGVYVYRLRCGGLDIYVDGKRMLHEPAAACMVNNVGAVLADLESPLEIVVQTPTELPRVYAVSGGGGGGGGGDGASHWVMRGGGPNGYVAECREAVSADGITQVPYMIVQRNGHQRRPPKNVLVYGYGSYGVPTFNGKVGSLWGPLLRRGWAIVYAMIRGGGDGTDSWADAARLTGRVRGVEDFEAVIAAARRALGGVPASRTVIAGRSAGGLLVGAALVRQGAAKLFGGVYAEVPYVDIMRTTTNPGLPLTTVEYDEFGWPAGRVVDFAGLLGLAPIENVPAGVGVPDVFVVCRSGANDTQVLAYEPMKWVRRLRGDPARPSQGEPKLLALKEGQGHFYRGAAAAAARAEDLALLSTLVAREKNRAYKYKSKMATRKSRKERKSRKNMAGGKRRRAGTRKAARKGRKATRKH